MALDFLAGCLGGCAGVAVGHPFDTIKVKLQTQDALNPRYKGTWHCLLETIKQDSFKGLYRGMSSPMAGVAVVNAVIFGVHGNIMKRVDNPDLLRSHVLAGSAAGFIQAFIASPMELSKTRMQIMSEASPGNKALYKNPLDCFKQIYKADGIRGIFRGQAITICREVPAFSTYFLTYEYMVRKMCPSGDVSNTAIFGAGGLAGMASWLVCYPMDVIKSRIQADGMFTAAKYKGIVDCVKKSVRLEGWSVLTRGLNTTLIRAFPTNAATFAVVNWTMNMFQVVEEAEEAGLDLLKDVKDTGKLIVESVPRLDILYNSVPTNIMSTSTNLLEKTMHNVKKELKYLENVSCKCFKESRLKPYAKRVSSELRSGVPHIITEVNICSMCGRCLQKGVEFMSTTSQSFRNFASAQQTLSNSL